MANSPICSIPNCGKNAATRGWCNRHYQQWRRTGNPIGAPRTPNGEPLRFIHDTALKHEGPECLTWPYGRDGKGAGSVRINGRHTVVSRYICELVHGSPPSPTHEAAHSCGKGHEACVAPTHISWKTPVENMADKLIHGTDHRGVRHPLSKLTDEDVLKIRELYSQGLTQQEIANQFGITRSVVGNIHHGRTWAHLSQSPAPEN